MGCADGMILHHLIPLRTGSFPKKLLVGSSVGVNCVTTFGVSEEGAYVQTCTGSKTWLTMMHMDPVHPSVASERARSTRIKKWKHPLPLAQA